MAHSIHQARKVQIRDLLEKQEASEPLLRPPWFIESIHGEQALHERQSLRGEGRLNRPVRGKKCSHADFLAWRARNV